MELHFKRQVEIGAIIAITIIFFLIDNLISGFSLPIKIGLANSIIIILLDYKGFKEAFFVNLSKVILGNLLIGKIFTPVFFFSFAGSIMSVVAMYLVIKIFSQKIGFIGIGISGAIAHNISQITIFWLFSGRNNFLFGAINYIIVFSAIFGILVGYLAYLLNQRKIWSKIQEAA